jgi:hypothetical protein
MFLSARRLSHCRSRQCRPQPAMAKPVDLGRKTRARG